MQCNFTQICSDEEKLNYKDGMCVNTFSEFFLGELSFRAGIGTSVLEGRCPAEFSQPWLELNSAGHHPSRTKVAYPCFRDPN